MNAPPPRPGEAEPAGGGALDRAGVGAEQGRHERWRPARSESGSRLHYTLLRRRFAPASLRSWALP